MTVPSSHVYRFADFRLDPAARELWQGDELLDVPRLVFGALTLLVENRERAVSRDELIEAVWGRPYVEDILVTQIIMRLRRLIGDDSQNPAYIRTVPGVGYRWIAETVEISAPAGGDAAGITAAPWNSVAYWQRAANRFRRWWMPAFAVLCTGALIVLAIHDNSREQQASPVPREPGEAVAVLPLETHAPDGSDIGWVRLGAMDLIAGHLREAGLPVPPSDSVVAALHMTTGLPGPEREAALRRTLGAGILVRGSASLSDDGWTLELAAATADGIRRRVESGHAEIIAAAGLAADQLLAALGKEAPVADRAEDSLGELLQRARAASLALELETARSVLTQAAESLRDRPELLLELALVEYRAGRFDAASEITAGLLDHPELATDRRLQARVGMMQGYIAMREREDDWMVAKPYFDAAIEALDEDLWAPELGTALAIRGGIHAAELQLDAAALDLSRARALFEVNGDRLGVARIQNSFGHLELERKRPARALPYFQASREIMEAFGHVDWLRASLFSLLLAQTQLLYWPDALTTGEDLWALHERIQDPILRYSSMTAYAAALVGNGRYREADTILAALRREDIDDIPFVDQRDEAVTRADLAWRRAQPDQVLQAASRVLESWPRSGTPVVRSPADAAYLALLHQRAAIAAGHPAPAAGMLSGLHGIEDEPAYLVSRAEWTAYQGDHGEAEMRFRMALSQAENWAVPATLVLVADAYAGWLLTRDRITEALALAGRVIDWAGYDYDAALLQVRVLHASGHETAWADALSRAERLAGERSIPDELRQPPITD